MFHNSKTLDSMNWLPEEDIEGIYSVDFLDDLMNHIECPPDEEDVDTSNGEGGDWFAKFQELDLPSEITSLGNGKSGRVETQKTVPASKQSSSSEALSSVNNNTLQRASLPPDTKVSKLFQSLSPVSVLENICGSLSPQNAKSQRLAFPVKRMRSKRKRPTHPTTMKLSYLFPFEPKKPGKSTLGETKRKYQLKTHTMSSSFEASDPNMISRKCTHCETTKTPQWREGPSGPKTLCNACGVRYRSGRLVPEYRPASSPTFIPSVHSNSHRKIIEMRRKEENPFDTRARPKSFLSLVSDPQNGNSMEEEGDGVKVGS